MVIHGLLIAQSFMFSSLKKVVKNCVKNVLKMRI
jgi:hypothetical protein